MSYYKNQSGRPVSVVISKHDSALVPPNYFVFVDPQVERRYDTKQMVRLGILIRCGKPSDQDTCIMPVSTSESVESVAPVKSLFAESLIEFQGSQQNKR